MRADLVFVLGVAAGIGIGMVIEHRRFLAEMQGLSKKHATDEPATPVAEPAS